LSLVVPLKPSFKYLRYVKIIKNSGFVIATFDCKRAEVEKLNDSGGFTIRNWDLTRTRIQPFSQQKALGSSKKNTGFNKKLITQEQHGCKH